MKLRIKGNTIRLRLTQGEVDEFRVHGKVSDQLNFGGGSPAILHYILERHPEIKELTAVFTVDAITVQVPEITARAWVDTDQVGFDNRETDRRLPEPYILVEKDFQCLHKRPHEDESDHFPNPLA